MRNFMKLVCVGLGIGFCFFSLTGQNGENIRKIKDIDPYSMTVQEKPVFSLQQEVQLRKGENKMPEVLPDSIITYTAAGEKMEKKVINGSGENFFRGELFVWENNRWIGIATASFRMDELDFFVEDHYYLHQPKMGTGTNTYALVDSWSSDMEGNYETHPVKVTYTDDGQVSIIDIYYPDKDDPYHPDFRGKVWISYHFIYNETGQLVSEIDYYIYPEQRKSRQYDYYYNENGDMTLYETYSWSSDKQEKTIYNWNERQIAKFDSEKRKIREEKYVGNQALQRYLLNEYDVYYYSNGTTIPNVVVGNNPSVGSNNQSSFDLDVNIPIDSISNGSITITFPEGFTLDEKNTILTPDFAGLFNLVITKQENNSWLLEIKPKTLKNTSLRADEVKKMLQVAYTVDAKIKHGTYDISVNTIIFESKGGNYIPEPAITVPAVLTRWGVGNEQIEPAEVTVYLHGQNLYIQSEKAERITIYSISGIKLYEIEIQAGRNTINAANFPQGILLFKGSSGWTTKVVH